MNELNALQGAAAAGQRQSVQEVGHPSSLLYSSLSSSFPSLSSSPFSFPRLPSLLWLPLSSSLPPSLPPPSPSSFSLPSLYPSSVLLLSPSYSFFLFFSPPLPPSSLPQEILSILEMVVCRNQVREDVHVSCTLFEAWRQLVEVTLHSLGEEGVRREVKMALLFELIQDLLLKVHVCKRDVCLSVRLTNSTHGF